MLGRLESLDLVGTIEDPEASSEAIMTDLLSPQNAVQVVRGSSKILRLTVTDPSTGKAADLSTATVVLTVKESAEDVRNVFQKTSAIEDQIEITDPFGGIAKIYIDPPDTRNREVKSYVFDVWVLFETGEQYVVVLPSTFDIQHGIMLPSV